MTPQLPSSSSSPDRPDPGREPQVRPDDDGAGFVRVTGRFFRAVDPQYADSARAVAPRPLPLGSDHREAGPAAAITPLRFRNLPEKGKGAG